MIFETFFATLTQLKLSKPNQTPGSMRRETHIYIEEKYPRHQQKPLISRQISTECLFPESQNRNQQNKKDIDDEFLC